MFFNNPVEWMCGTEKNFLGIQISNSRGGGGGGGEGGSWW